MKAQYQFQFHCQITNHRLIDVFLRRTWLWKEATVIGEEILEPPWTLQQGVVLVNYTRDN